MKITAFFKVKKAKWSPRRGFSLLELLIAMAAISSVVAMGLVQFSGTTSSVKEAKLHQDVAALNRAVSTYRISGGNLDALTTGSAVLQKLKTAAAQRTRVAGLRGTMIDPRLQGVSSSGNGTARAVWDDVSKTFVVGKTGSGFREFVIEGAVETHPPVEEKRTVLMAMDSGDKWIWRFHDPSRNAFSPRQPARTPAEVVAPAELAGMKVLSAPRFSIPGALYDFDAYDPDLKVSLIDPNPDKSAEMFYSVSNGPWQRWTGTPISLARALTTDVRAYSLPVNADRFEESAVAAASYETIYFGGSSAGVFSNPKGDSALASNLNGGKSGAFFTWGSPATPAGFKNPNSLQVTGKNFAVVAPDQLFELANLTYYNGSTYAGTNATEVQLNVTLNLTTPGLSETLPFIFKLLSTPNHGVNANADADYVYIPTVSTKCNTIIKGQTFYLVLSFGSNSANGFTTIDKFHVHENKTMTGSIYGRFTTSPPLL